MSIILIVTMLIAAGLGPIGRVADSLASKVAQISWHKPTNQHSMAMGPATLTAVPSAKPYNIQAESGAIMDSTTGSIVASKQPHQRLEPASLTKLMTAIVIMNRHQPDEIVTIQQSFSADQTDAQALGLRVGQQFRLEDIMKMLLIYSANDAAEALAIYDAGSKEAFVARMNEHAKQLGLNDTHFENPTGLDQSGHVSSVADLATMSRVLLQNPRFREIIKTPKTTVKSLGGTPYSFTSTNQLLAYPYIIGLKTGKTGQAGECLITLSAKDGHEIITVVLNSPNRFQESKNMVDWAFANTIWK